MKIDRMRHIIAGTAGHIDHGKTALVRALTGIDTDRLEEEKRRGISIDLGFAHLDLAEAGAKSGGIRLGFIDVPGHERFIKNMLAGAGGIDFVLFIIAADESIKPQTREHFDICRLLRIPTGVIAITKTDLVEPELVELVRLETEEFVTGSFLEGAAIIPVSASTGQGIGELRSALAAVAGKVAAKDATRWFRLPLDRVFSMRGFGTVITGTLVSGSIGEEQEVEIQPLRRKARVRGVQVHGEKAARAIAGQRTALNIAGIEPGELARGMVATEPDRFEPTETVDAIFELLPSAKPLKHGAPVHFHAGTAEIEAEVRVLGEGPSFQPNARAFARFLLREPALLMPGDRFIVRMFSPVTTIGGGEVLDIAPPPKLRRAAAARRLEVLESGTREDRLSLLVRESAYGLSMQQIIARTGWMPPEIEAATKSQKFLAIREPQFWVADRAWVDATAKRMHALLADFHRKNALQAGISKQEIRSRELPGAPAFLLEHILSTIRTIAVEGETIRLASHRIALKQDEEAASAKIEAAFADAGLAVPSTAEVLARSGVEAIRARSLLQILLKGRKLVRVGDDLVFHPSALDRLRQLLAERKGLRFSVAEFKDWTGISRKYAIPLLEFLDREHVTRREGDARVVL
jgi:selenocysteine-specific elongation factor